MVAAERYEYSLCSVCQVACPGSQSLQPARRSSEGAPGRAGLPHQPPAHGVPCWPHLTSRPGMDPHLELPPGSRPRSTWDPGTAQAEPQRKKRSAPQTEDDVLTSSVPAPTGYGQNGVLTYKGLETQQLCNLVPVADARGGAGCSQRGAFVSG